MKLHASITVILTISLVLAGGCSRDTVTAPDAVPGTGVQVPDAASSAPVITLEGLKSGQGRGQVAGIADVAVTDFTGTPVVHPGDVLTLQATVANLGSEMADGPFDVWVGVLNTGFTFGRVTLDGLAGGDSRSGTIDFDVPVAEFAKSYAPGTYTLYCTHDFMDADPSNNYMLSEVELVTGASLPFPDTPDQLMANFKTVYEAMDSDVYRDLIHPDFMMILEPSTIQDFPEVGETLDFDEEMGIAGNMFSGAPGHDPEGFITAPVSSIAVPDLERLSVWEISPANDPIPNTRSALFQVRIEFNRTGDTTLRVTGQVKFYVTARDSLYQGEVRPYYQMVGQSDYTNDTFLKSNEDVCFGSAKALYR